MGYSTAIPWVILGLSWGTGFWMELVPVESLANKTHRSSSSRALQAARMHSSTGGGFWALIPCEFQGESCKERQFPGAKTDLPKPFLPSQFFMGFFLQTCSCSSCSKSSKISPCLAQGPQGWMNSVDILGWFTLRRRRWLSFTQWLGLYPLAS